jgi:hypothetical protein
VTLLFPESGASLGADYSMTDGYLGFATLPLAAAWLFSGDAPARRKKRWLGLFALAMFLLSLGGAGGLRWVLHFVFPLLHPLRFNAPFRPTRPSHSRRCSNSAPGRNDGVPAP